MAGCHTHDAPHKHQSRDEKQPRAYSDKRRAQGQRLSPLRPTGISEEHTWRGALDSVVAHVRAARGPQGILTSVMQRLRLLGVRIIRTKARKEPLGGHSSNCFDRCRAPAPIGGLPTLLPVRGAANLDATHQNWVCNGPCAWMRSTDVL